MAANFDYDRSRYFRFSGIVNCDDPTNLEALVTMDYHRLEKGLSLQTPRSDFGESTARDLAVNLQRLLDVEPQARSIQIGLQVLTRYLAFRRNQGTAIIDLENNPVLSACRPCSPEEQLGGILNKTGSEIREASQKCTVEFFSSRHSIRTFSSVPVERSLIERATEIALTTPSVCNRQAWNIIAVDSAAQLDGVLKLQNGNRSFRNQIPCVLTVTCDLRQFVSVGERNQAWIDGGMFSMTLVYALHHLGLGTCCLNWSVEKETDSALKRLLEIQDSSVVIMMIAVGHLPSNLAVARSKRKSIAETLRFRD